MKPFLPNTTDQKLRQQEAFSPSNCEASFYRDMVARHKVSCWSAITRVLDQDQEAQEISSRDCREGSPGQVEATAKTQSWSPEEEKKLLDLHNAYGNKWAKIAEILQGRTDNSIKNHFYCTLRKALRRVNRYIAEQRHKSRSRQIKNSILSKIIAVAQERFESKLQVPEHLIQKCNDIKNRLIQFAKEQEFTPEVESELKTLINEINDFNRAYKKKKAKKKSKDGAKSKMSDSEEQGDDDKNDQPGTTATINMPAQRSPQLGRTLTMQLLFQTQKQKSCQIYLSRSMEFDLEQNFRGSPLYSRVQQVEPSSPPFSISSYYNPFSTLSQSVTKFRPIVLKDAGRNRHEGSIQ